MKNVLLSAECHNWGLSTVDDWHQTHYKLFEDGTLQMEVLEGRDRKTIKRHIDEADLVFIKENTKKYIDDMPIIEACDGVAWEFQGPDYTFDLGYIYGTALEKVANILSKYSA